MSQPQVPALVFQGPDSPFPTSGAAWKCCRASTRLQALVKIYDARHPNSPYDLSADSPARDESVREPSAESPAPNELSEEEKARELIQRVSESPELFSRHSEEVQRARGDSGSESSFPSNDSGGWKQENDEVFQEMAKNRPPGFTSPEEADPEHPTVSKANNPRSCGVNVMFAYQRSQTRECIHCGHTQCEACEERKRGEVAWVDEMVNTPEGKKVSMWKEHDTSPSPAPSDEPVDWEEEEEEEDLREVDSPEGYAVSP